VFCQSAERALDSLQMVYGDSLVILSYHSQAGDTFLNVESKERGSYYNYGVEPSAVFDGGTPYFIEGNYYTLYQDQILGARSQATSLTMEFDTANTKMDTNQINIGLNITPTESLPDRANLRLFVVVYEKTANYLSAFPPHDTLHSLFVARKMLPDTLGVNLTVDFPGSFDTTFVTTVGNLDKTQIGVASFVQNIQTKEVLQSIVKRNF
jgi:hypothetical protein